MIPLLRWGSRITLLVALAFGLLFAVRLAGPPEWADRDRITFTLEIADAIRADGNIQARLNEGAQLLDVFAARGLRIDATGLRYRGGVLLLPNGRDSFHYFDIQGACWNFVQPRITSLDQCPR